MFKIIENNQIIDVVENLKFVKCLPKSKKIICVDERQANGIMASNGNEVYHDYGTPHTFEGEVRSVRFEEIDAEEYERLTQQVKKNEQLENRNKFLHTIFGKYFPDEFIEILLDKKEDELLGGDRRHIAVLFCDLRGFSAIAEEISGEKMTDLLNCFFGEMLEGIIKRDLIL